MAKTVYSFYKLLMNIILNTKTFQITVCIFILSLICLPLASQITVVNGTVKDSLSGEPISFVTVRFENSTSGSLTDDKGKFRIGNNQDKNTVVVSQMGYRTKKVTVPIKQTTNIVIELSPEGVGLNEVVIRPKKEKYSKKNNPAVELIKKVIANKNNYTITNQDYYKSEEYDRILFAFNEFNKDKAPFKNFEYLADYTSYSKIDNKLILPFSVRETSSDVYYRKSSNDTRRVFKGYNIEGLDQTINTESIDDVIKGVFKDISITDNDIEILLRDFVSPLSSSNAVDFYRWYIIDTVTIEQNRYINLGFVPFNTRDVGFIGNLYIAADSTYALKRYAMRIPSKANINFIDEMYIWQDFEQKAPNLWVPKEGITAIEASLYGTIKMYVEKNKAYQKFTFNQPLNSIFHNPSPEIYLKDYKKQDDEFWQAHRPSISEDLHMDNMMQDILSNKLLNIGIKVADIVSSNGYIPTSSDEEKNKVDIGTTMNFYSFNLVEGNRFRLTGATTRNFHKHLFLYGYLAYGTKDRKFKYMSEVTWAFNNRKYHKDEFPRNNLSFSYKYDVNALGQRFLQAERDNIFMSTSKKRKLTYERMGQIEFIKEYYNNFSFNIFSSIRETKPAGSMVFEVNKGNSILDTIPHLRFSEVGVILRYAQNEKFVQQRRKRRNLPSNGFIYTLGFYSGFKDVFGGQFDYQKLTLSIDKEFWLNKYGKVYMTLLGEKVWGEVPFTMLLSGSSNSSFTIQRGSFDLLESMEFTNDVQFTWHLDYRMGGWLFNRLPLLKQLKLREVFGFKGFIGSLSKRNNPKYNSDLLVFPNDVFSMGDTPYMEVNVGVENIFQFFRINYVRRLNYLDNPNVSKSGIRIGFDLRF
ncbi:carboxypeptidase-like regulatory domain-containing protein [Dysgonomonas sp. 216]|uniref:DUF5686 and carboxypeptidase-like regulatory domain-containing protein n=1 Tax=Dysgonomonas sp. 216 TaxID=2302934 RepID=UPI0013D5F5EC|nr:DUF5686 and carboxypeptidase-like regulatory domain-containing protein [Dysgonomonas sp. 216]NDW18550.1 carboxypeptidase-like regulatory domain-containing protein [Dysgonomonas sp. 216]